MKDFLMGANFPVHQLWDQKVGVSQNVQENKELYCQIVKKAIREIKNGTFRKLVLSRTKTFELPQKFDPLLIFEKLCNAYPNSFIYLVSIPSPPLTPPPAGGGRTGQHSTLPQGKSDGKVPPSGGFRGATTWMGASPEILLSVDHNNIFKTIAMAGTQPLKPGTSPKKAAWTQKEIEEQALVSRFIINCFKKIRLREFEEEGPKTIIAGNLMHLRTDYTVDMNAVNFPELGTVMLDLLHPTSAVCGMPKNESMEFILANENYDREFYTGYLGPVNMPCQVETPDTTETHLFVNLRCMQLLDNKAILYAGSGITEDSEPESEWDETELKCKTILDVIGK
ncbi:MAG: chorismate-binding protein [Bacteroidetes bacterium]|nr:chorismate-binding protein [Bacteroidota bacterium]